MTACVGVVGVGGSPAVAEQARAEGSSCPPVSEADSSEGWSRLGESDVRALRERGRVHVAVGGEGSSAGRRPRYVTVLRIAGNLSVERSGGLRAVDAVCFHAGGPLGNGDIEQVGEQRRLCIKCPWHDYLIDLDTGEKWHQQLQQDDVGRLVPTGWKNSGQAKQRVHDVEEVDGDVWVRLRLGGSCESDWWAHNQDCLAALGLDAVESDARPEPEVASKRGRVDGV